MNYDKKSLPDLRFLINSHKHEIGLIEAEIKRRCNQETIVKNGNIKLSNLEIVK